MPTSVRTNLFTDPYGGNEAYSETGTAGGANTTGTVTANASGSGFRVVAPASGSAWRSPLRHSTLSPSTTYTVRMLITSTTSTTNLTFVHRPNANVGTSTGSVTIGAPPLVAGVPYEYVATFTTTSTTIPAGSSGVGIVTTVFQVGNNVTIDGIVIRAGTFTAAEMQPFSGDPADTQALTYAWTGAQWASTSTETFSWQDVSLSAVATITGTAAGLKSVTLTAPATLSVDTLDSALVPFGLTSAITAEATGFTAIPFAALTASIDAVVLPRITLTEGSTSFSYWEKRRKDFGQLGQRRAQELKPFWYQSDAVGVHVVRSADGVFTTVEVVDEALENTPGVRIFYGGKKNLVTDDEASELEAAGYGDYLTGKIENAFNQGAYSEGDYGA